MNRLSCNLIANRMLRNPGDRLSAVKFHGRVIAVRSLFSSTGHSSKEVTTASSPKKALALDDQPVVFTQSPAYREWKAAYLIELPDHRPPIQRPVCFASIVIFMLYFFIIREENDLDELIYQPLTKTVPDLELSLLESTLESYAAQNLPTMEIEKKIAETKAKAQLKEKIEREKEKKAASQ